MRILMNPLSSDDSGFDFAKLLEQSLEQDAFEVRRGDLLTGTILAVDDYGIIVDCGLKRDGVVPRSDLEDLGLSPQDFAVGSELRVMVVRMEDRDGKIWFATGAGAATNRLAPRSIGITPSRFWTMVKLTAGRLSPPTRAG